MFGWLKKKIEQEKHNATINSLVEFRIKSDDEMKCAPSRFEQICAAVKILGNLIEEQGMTTTGWVDGWPREIVLQRERNGINWRTDLSVTCFVDVSGAYYDRVAPPKFFIEFGGEGEIENEEGDSDGKEDGFQKDNISIKAIDAALTKMFEREEKFISTLERDA